MKIKYMPFLLMAMGMASCKKENKAESAPKADVVIHPDEVISSEFIGNGVEFSAYPHGDADNAEWGKLMTDEKWQEVFDRVDYIQPKIVRVMDQANWRYLQGFDVKGSPVTDYNSGQEQALYKLLDYCQKNNITVILGEWGQPYKVHDVQLHLQDKFTGANDPNWIKLIVGNLKNLIQDRKYTCIKYYNLVNEPNGYWATTDGDWKQWKGGIELLHKAIDDAGLSGSIAVIGPDATSYDNPKSEYKGLEWPNQAVQQLSGILGAYDVHDYPSKESVRSGEFQKTFGKVVSYADSLHKKPFILGELGIKGGSSGKHDADNYTSKDSQVSVYDYDYGVDMADAVVQAMDAGFDAAVAWDLDDAMHTNGDTGDKHQLKRWGMWNILGKELTGDASDENIRPWFYTWSLMCRYYKGDMKIVKMEGLDKFGTRGTAGISGNGDATLTFVNNTDKPAEFTVDVSALKSGITFKKYLYTESRRAKDEHGFPVPAEKDITAKIPLKIAVPAKSVVLYTSYNF